MFMIYCAPCHSLESTSEGKNTIGPSLGLIFNRKTATDFTYEGYSNAMINSRIYWTTRNLYRFMISPQQVV